MLIRTMTVGAMAFTMTACSTLWSSPYPEVTQADRFHCQTLPDTERERCFRRLEDFETDIRRRERERRADEEAAQRRSAEASQPEEDPS